MLAAAEQDKGAAVLFMLIATVVTAIWLFRWRGRVIRAGYRGVFAYLRSVPRTDAAKRDALDLVMRGFVMFVPGAIVWPIGLVCWLMEVAGLFSLYYGIRKLLMLKMGLELLEEPNGITGESSTRPDSEQTGI
ncbi:MAG: hypothetical protein JXQ75_05290 [Phycisphaerae bacterium]|nr:hypothetical protein [Phycisphaerae bacterium]